MNNEPVAWMHKESGQVFAGMGSPIKPDDFIPLYTHPAKTYEDAIEECAQRAEAYAYMSPNFTALAGELRAILRKAQENPLQDKLDAIANKVVFGKAQEK